ncbi:hypothetical protein RND81_04G137200 [Saponaria officinalis]|uniref:Uncharacterized protein n=1 Tax=Saponaria officinalis TaxID=3572 RepID=A0AAW1LJ65_SAPOF
MMPTELNNFDKFCNIFPDSIPLKQIAELALIGKVISFYKIDSLSSFHDQLMEGLWKKSLNGCLYPLDSRLEELLYVEINENFKADTEKSLEKLRSFNIARKVFNETSEPTSPTNHKSVSSNEVLASLSGDNGSQGYENGESQVNDRCLKANFDLTDEVNGNINRTAPPIFVDDVQLLNACDVFVEIPKKDDEDVFVEMPKKDDEVSKDIEEVEVVAQDDHVLSAYNVFDGSHCLKMESTLAFNDGKMLLNVKRQHFIPILGVKTESVLNVVRKNIELESVGWNLNGLMDSNANVLVFFRFVNNIYLLLVLVCLCFDPGGKKLKPLLLYNLTLEDKGDFRGEEEKICVKYIQKSFIFVFTWPHVYLIFNKVRSTSTLIWIFDPGGIVGVSKRVLRKESVFKHSKDDLRIAIKWFATVVFFYIFDPGGLNNSLMLTMSSYVAICDSGGLVIVTVWVFDPGGSSSIILLLYSVL